jgi:hypothetical protein
MPENIVETTPVVDAPAINPEIAQSMAIALNGGLVPEKKEETTTQTTTQTQPVVTDPFKTITDKFGYSTAEDAVREIEELRALKANPPKADLKFENPESETLFKAWQKGDKASVLTYLERQQRIENFISKEVTPDTAADIVKMGMQLKYQEQNLTPEEINYKFNKTFAVPAKPIQGADEEKEPYDLRLSAWNDIVADKKMELMIEAKLAKPEIEQAKAKLVLPQIDTVDEGYLQYTKALADNKIRAAESKEAYLKAAPESIETKLNFNDEANKIAFEFQFKPNAESFSKTVDMVSNIDNFWAYFNGQDGKPDRTKFLKTIHNAINMDAMLTEAMKQSKNATIKAMLPDNSQGGLVRQMVGPNAEPTEMEKEMERRGIKKSS